MAFEYRKSGSRQHVKAMTELYDLIQRTNKKPAKDSTDLSLPEQEERVIKKSVGKDGKPLSLVELNAIAARKNTVTLHKLEPAEIVHKNVGTAVGRIRSHREGTQRLKALGRAKTGAG